MEHGGVDGQGREMINEESAERAMARLTATAGTDDAGSDASLAHEVQKSRPAPSAARTAMTRRTDEVD